MHYSLVWSKDPGPSADGEVPHYWRVYTRHFFTEFEVRRRYMKELSIFIDESGDFGIIKVVEGLPNLLRVFREGFA